MNFIPPKPFGADTGAGGGAGLGDPAPEVGAGVRLNDGGKGGSVGVVSPENEGSDLIFGGKEEEEEEPGFGL